MLGILFFGDTILSVKLRASELQKREPVSENAHFYGFLQSAVEIIG
jgi:hypothetical protein